MSAQQGWNEDLGLLLKALFVPESRSTPDPQDSPEKAGSRICPAHLGHGERDQSQEVLVQEVQEV